MKIPYQQLSSDTLHGIIRDFVLREGTDYGMKEYSIEDKIAAVRRQLERGEACVVFDSKDETCDIKLSDQLERGDS